MKALVDPETEWPAAVDALKVAAKLLKQKRTQLANAKLQVANLETEVTRTYTDFDIKRAAVQKLVNELSTET